MAGFMGPAYPTITMNTLEKWVEQGKEMTVIDLRDRTSYSSSHFTGAVNLPYGEIEEWKETLPKDRLHVFYCSRGSCSMAACSRLSQEGYQVVSVVSGFIFYRGRYTERMSD